MLDYNTWSRHRVARLTAALAIAGAAAGCSQMVRQGGFAEVEQSVTKRGVSQSVRWNDGSADDRAAEDAVRDLLARELSVDAAVQVALLENPSLQATYEELGIAQANLVQAGLLKNPVFIGQTLFGGVSPAYDFDIVQGFLDGLLIPARKRIAGAGYEEARLRVAGEVFELTAKVRAAYYRLQGAEQLVLVLQAMSEASEASTEFAERLHAAGNLSDLDVANERALLAEMRAELLQAKADTVDPREDFRRLLGLSDSDVEWRVPATLPGLPATDPTLDDMMKQASEQHLEIAASRQDEAVLAETLETARFWRYFGGVEVGAMAHREQGDNNWIAGPSLALELPIFDQRQADIADLEFRLRQSEHRTAARAQDVLADVRRAHGTLRSERELAEHYREALIPARERVVALAERFYHFMLLGTFELLNAKRTEIASYREYVGAVRDYWIAVADLEKAVGARVAIRPASEPAVSASFATSSGAEHARHHSHSSAPAPAAGALHPQHGDH